jgi:hypothetical protein
VPPATQGASLIALARVIGSHYNIPSDHDLHAAQALYPLDFSFVHCDLTVNVSVGEKPFIPSQWRRSSHQERDVSIAKRTLA